MATVTTHIETPYGTSGFISGRFFRLLAALSLRELRGRYRRSFLGPVWAVLQPLALMLLFVMIKTLLGVDTGDTPYAIFAYSALVPWTYFSNCVSRSANSVYANAPIIKKIAVAREIFPLSVVCSALVDACITCIILIGLMIYFQVAVTWHLLWVPVLFLLVTMLASGLGLLIAAVATYRRDVQFMLQPLLQLWMFATPIMYPLSKVPDQYLAIYTLNPLLGVIDGFRTVIVHGGGPDFAFLGITAAAAIFVWAVGWPFFRYMAQYFADVI